MKFERPEPGAYPTLYEPAAFYPCYLHPQACTLVVLVTTEREAYFDEPVCAECGREVFPGATRTYP